MFFEYPKLLWLLVLPLLLAAHYIWRELSGRRPHMRVSTVQAWMSGGRSALVPGHLPKPKRWTRKA